MVLSKLSKSISEFEFQCSVKHTSIAEKWAKKDENGKMLTPKGKPQGSYEIPEENVKEYQKEMEELESKEWVWEGSLLPISKLEGVNLTPNDLVYLEDFILDLSSVETPVKELKAK